MRERTQTIHPPFTMGATQAGMILGTAAYMSPEQARGKNVDKRADIWAFGVVLYEMLTGRRLFDGEDVGDVLAAVIKDEPDWTQVPPEVQRLLKSCLEKDPRKRLRDIGDAWKLLDDAPPVGGGLVRLGGGQARLLPWIVAGVALLVGAAGAYWLRKPAAADVFPIRFTVAPAEGSTLDPDLAAGPQIAVSPDGRQLAFVATDRAGKRHLWVRPLGSVSGQQMDRTEDAIYPFWSPNSQAIAFFADGKLKRIAISGASPSIICDAPAGNGGTWSADGVIVFAPAPNGPLHHVPATGGVSTPLTTLDQAQGEISHDWPQFLPGGKRFLYLAKSTRPDKSGIYVQGLGSAERKFLFTTENRAVFDPSGRLLFLRDGTLLAQAMSAGSLRLEGDPVSIAEDVNQNLNGRDAFSISENGVLAYRSGFFGNQQIAWYTRDGKRAGSVLGPGAYRQIELSPDDRFLALERREGSTGDLWLLGLSSGVFSRLTFGSEYHGDPIWSPDSRRLAFDVNLGSEIREVTVGASNEKRIYADGKVNWVDDWSADGQFLIYHTANDNSVSLWEFSGARKPRVLMQTPFIKDAFRISPDGRWIAYESTESGQAQVMVANFPDFTNKRQISTGGGGQVRWRKDGKELFYLALDGRLMAVDVKAGATLETGSPKLLFQTAAVSTPGSYYYAVTGDGQRFLIREPAANGGTEQINVVVNWQAGLSK